MASYKPYSIVSPEYDWTSGGIKVMYGLYGWLLAKGQIVVLNSGFNQPFVGIYPEIISGNPVNATTVVRYILAPLGEMALVNKSNDYRDVTINTSPLSYPPTDRLYSFSKLIYPADDAHTMFLPIIDTHLFKNQYKKRTKKAVLYGKQPNRHLHPENCFEIDRRFAQNQAALADLLNDCQMLYVYDHRTAMTEVARLCGCPVTIYPSVYTKEQFQSYEPGMNGITWGDEELVKLDGEKFRADYISLRHTFELKLDQFIEDTQHD